MARPKRTPPKPRSKERGPVRRSRAWPASLVLLALVVLFCAVTDWGRTYPKFASRTWQALVRTRGVPRADRLVRLYDDTYPVLLYMRFLPEDAVVLVPPVAFVRRMRNNEIPLLASPTSTYSFIYPRVPVHFDQPSPFRDRIDHLLVWEHWGLDWVDPEAPHTEQNRVGLYPWPADREVPW